MSTEPKAPSVKSYPKSTDTKWARMRFWLLALLTIKLSFLILSCGLDVEDPTPPSPPVWVEKSLPEEWPERGIDAHESGGIFLEWESESDEDLMFYSLYRGEYYMVNDSFSTLDLLIQIDVESLNALEYIDDDVFPSIDYSYAIEAIDISSNISRSSDTITYRSLLQISTDLMRPNGTDELSANNKELRWSYDYQLDMEDYCLTILSQNNELVSRTIFVPTNYTGWTESWSIPTEIQLEPEKIYKWRIDAISSYEENLERAGSESGWATFIYR